MVQKSVLSLLLFPLFITASACAPELDSGDNFNDDRGDVGDKLARELEDKYGLAPKNYPFLFNESSEAERIFSQEISDSTTRLNAIAAAKGYSFKLNEGAIGLNFISEGGYFPLKDNRVDFIDGYGEVGIDTLVSNFAALRPWLDTTLADEIAGCDLAVFEQSLNCPALESCNTDYYACIDAGQVPEADCDNDFYSCEAATNCTPAPDGCTRIQGNENERGEFFYSMTNLTMKEAVSANASMFAYSTAEVERKFESIGLNFNDQLAIEQFFWSTMFFNAGAGTAGRRLDEHGHEYYLDKWPAGQAENSLNPLYNALWRTSTYEYIMHKVYGGLPDGQ